ncbi:5'-nucleotidase [Phycisphaeraceae bacterium D3-23]
MPYDLTNRFVLGVSSRALFDLAREHTTFEQSGPDTYDQHQKENRTSVLEQGTAFPLVQRFLGLNIYLPKERNVEVILFSRHSPEAGQRIKHSAYHYGLPISRYSFTRGAPVGPYLQAFSVNLFLSAEPEDVRLAFDADIPAAVTFAQPRIAQEREDPQIRIAFDGDGVLFGSESEAINQANGLDAFHKHEIDNARKPLKRGPFARLLVSLSYLQRRIDSPQPLIRTALITARNAPADERVLTTLEAWRVKVDEHHYLGGVLKEGVLRAFAPDIFFDDQSVHCRAASHTVRTAQVPSNLFELAHSEVPLCPNCGAKMKKRIARRGKTAGRSFWGCSNYPKCNSTYDI